MKVLKALALSSMLFSFPVFAEIYQCNISMGWETDNTGQNVKYKALGSGPVDTTTQGKFFPIENTKLQFGCGGVNLSGKFTETVLTEPSTTNTDFLCMLSPSEGPSWPAYSFTLTKIGAPISLGVMVADDTLPMKRKTLYAICGPQPK